MDVTVIVATYGDLDRWEPLAKRAQKSAQKQSVPVQVIRVHGETLHGARNEALDLAETEYVIHLDADDTLHPRYVETLLGGTADIRVPSVVYLKNGQRGTAKMPQVAGHTHACTAECLRYGNWVVVGAMAPAELLREVGWRYFDMYEDWDLWLRCYLKGASFEPIPDAVYEAHVRVGSRNRAPDRSHRLEVHRQIARSNGVPVP